MSNSKLMDAFMNALSLGNTIPHGQDRKVLEKLTKQFAERNDVSYTEEELNEVMDYAIENLPMNERRSYEFPNGKMMR